MVYVMRANMSTLCDCHVILSDAGETPSTCSIALRLNGEGSVVSHPPMLFDLAAVHNLSNDNYLYIHVQYCWLMCVMCASRMFKIEQYDVSYFFHM